MIAFLFYWLWEALSEGNPVEVLKSLSSEALKQNEALSFDHNILQYATNAL